ncbi:hypothetical protein XFPR_12875 [Xylella fastidiosa]|uniref:Dirigent protein n=3 Tax=Xylella fastidiosa TaxID=2371 RepID=A0ABD7BXI3_XYLFS|nr:hypothetical protein [Xylella fastidiosa]ARO69080.1 hypothetical protein B9J09_08635 [Xylella fastidiosa subsp. pauca]QPB72596.1 hypothetical protein XFHB_13875 [Xylella fastidiosa]QPB72924.1 hypothetical protein XFPR_12875 [Xylella fastidiosa]QPB73233.1 hypothetical protein XFC3_13145 [Xylella fastidiosa]TNW21929.1 hypothetical protein EIP73_02235 [Xylella fastidiosa subsp. pauca]
MEMNQMRELAFQEIENVDGAFFFVIYPESFSNGTVSSISFTTGSSVTGNSGSLTLPDPVVSGPVLSGIGFFGTGTGFLRTSSRHVTIGTVNLYNIIQKINL